MSTAPRADSFDPSVAFRRVVGARWVDDDAATRECLQRATFSTDGRALARVRPGTVEEVAGCLRAASRAAVSVVVVSRGKNYGYSSSGPARGVAATLDLSRLVGIADFDDELGTVRVQAGVTFEQLHDFLAARDTRRYFPATGGPRDGSIVGNTLERGHGLGPSGDRTEHSCRYEVVTSAGERIETGFGRFAGARVADLARAGLGPSLDGLFTQSSMGVVTAMTLWLPRRPRHWATLLVGSTRRDRVGPIFGAVAEAVRRGLVRDGMAFAANDYKLASNHLRRSDFAPADGAPVSSELLATEAHRWMGLAWLGAVTVDADDRRVLAAKVRATRRLFDSMLTRADKRVLLTAWRCRLALLASRLLPAAKANVLRRFLALFHTQTPLLGHLVEAPLRTAYWATLGDLPVLTPPPEVSSASEDDLHADRVGLLWVSTLVPLRASEITAVCTCIEEVLLRHGFEPSTQVTLVSERLVRVVTALAYDRSAARQDDRAVRCARDAYAALERDGYVPYRLAPFMTDAYAPRSEPLARIVSTIGQTLDPAGVFAPSRYG